MLIRKDGIYRNIDSKDYGLYQQMGFEKVVTEPIVEPEPVKAEEPVIEEVKVEEPIAEEKPKAKKKKKV